MKISHVFVAVVALAKYGFALNLRAGELLQPVEDVLYSGDLHSELVASFGFHEAKNFSASCKTVNRLCRALRRSVTIRYIKELRTELIDNKHVPSWMKLKIKDLDENYGRRENFGHIAVALTNEKWWNVWYLELPPGHVVDIGMMYVLRENKTLITLKLSDIGMGIEGAKLLAEALKESKTLTTLNVSYNYIGSDGAKRLADALKENKTLTTLLLRDVGTEKDGVAYLAEVLEDQNETLTTLDLSGNVVGVDGAKYLWIALSKNSTLTSLFLNNTKIDATSAFLLLALRDNNTLTTLDLSDNPIVHGVTGVFEVLEKNENTTLRTLDLSNCGISPNHAIRLVEALKANKTLTSVDLRRNEYYGVIDQTRIAEIINENEILPSVLI